MLNTEINGLHIRSKIESVPGDYGAFYRNLYDVLGGEAKPVVTLAQVINVLTLIEKSYLSA